ncbi:hemerythrin [Pseudomonas taeanensis MS-3]|jgi:hemerythrin-like domain-containing protein|uniref:Hemerythrin n=1 Tax=Pseudomonas taeanensis MS-3 TaxID=1395571 RepID=A0A0A1YQR7_9PSED|nr:hemerythrin domain-containing protein [Pseudomonas taeanensis]KFX71493.1 hemerythrin [Pseudomonas taeanensis MS-3]
MTIFEALRLSHETQRELSTKLIDTSGDTSERQALFTLLKSELAAHSVAEERNFYIPLMQDDLGVDLSRHAIAEHHEMDEMIEELEETELSSPSWLAQAKKLSEKVHHHLQEEEQKFFQMAGKLLSDTQKEQLSGAYLRDYESLKQADA